MTLFFDILKYTISVENSIQQTQIQSAESVVGETKEILRECKFCSSPDDLTSLEEGNTQIQMFQNIINIDLKTGIIPLDGKRICNRCVYKMENISSFIRVSLCNDRTLHYAICKDDPSLAEIKNGTTNIKDDTEIGRNQTDFTKSNEMEVDSVPRTLENPFACNFVFLQNHVRTPTGEKPFKCDECGRCFGLKQHLKCHQLTHSEEKPFSCNLCEKSYIRKDSLENHLRAHAGEKPFNCDFCEKSFRQKVNLKVHMRIHSGDGLFKCDFCEKSFNRKEGLHNHLRTHTGEKPFKCQFCENGFTQRSALQKHVRTHTGEKPYKCDTCDKRFGLKHSLQYHLLTHTGEKPISCDLCEKSFRNTGNLKAHLRTHTGEKPFKCEFCEKRFAEKGKLKKHALTHTGEKLLKRDQTFSSERTSQQHVGTHSEEKPIQV